MKKKVRGGKKNVRSVTTLERLSGMDDNVGKGIVESESILRGFTEKGRNDKDDEEEYDEEELRLMRIKFLSEFAN